MLTAQVTVIILLRNIQAAQIAREVDGGVELLGKGEVELILPEELSFTIKSPGPFDGIAKMCYAAQTNSHRKHGYHNRVGKCPEGTCILLISDEFRAHGLRTQRRGSVVHYQFADYNDDMWCPRLVYNGHQNFTILQVPQAPLIVNGASLPKEQVAQGTNNLKWVIVICALLILLALLIIIVGIWICMHSKKKQTSVKHFHQPSQSRKSHCKTSPAVISPVSSKRHQSRRCVQLNSSNSANNIENV